jgi:hypothetical protein
MDIGSGRIRASPQVDLRFFNKKRCHGRCAGIIVGIAAQSDLISVADTIIIRIGVARVGPFQEFATV